MLLVRWLLLIRSTTIGLATNQALVQKRFRTKTCCGLVPTQALVQKRFCTKEKGMYRDTGFLTFDRHPAEVVALARRGLTHQFRTEHKQLTRTQATHISQRLLSILHKHHQERSFSSQQAVHQWKNKIFINTLVYVKRRRECTETPAS